MHNNKAQAEKAQHTSRFWIIGAGCFGQMAIARILRYFPKATLAVFICPDNCPEPKERCTHTGKTRALDMFRLLALLELGDTLPIVLRSYPLLPGVVGIHPADLWPALDTARNNSHRPLMIATACRYHGVVDLLCVKNRSQTAV